MSSFEPLVYCPNPACPNPLNHLGNFLCHSCQTPLIERYLWAVGSGAAQIQPGEKVVDRYQAIASQVWLDTRPGLPQFQGELLDDMLPYLQLYPQRLHTPEVFGSIALNQASSKVVLLENVPIDTTGHLCPSIADAWSQASPVRQVYWLWQILQLWTPLLELGVASSLLVAENLRVEGWRVRLLELVGSSLQQPSLQQLGECWQAWLTSQAPVAASLQEIAQQLIRGDIELAAIAQQLNQLLLSLAAELPLQSQVSGATDTGPQRSQNEDTCYPTAQDLSSDPVVNHLTIVCDGIGGHEGGEVASQLAVQSLKLQVRALLAEVAEQTEIVPPDLLMQQLEASLRVVNNLIAARNDAQGRSSKQRMGTTLVMAVQVPQPIQTQVEGVSKTAHELYLAHIGDSRAYWITRHHCLLLTVDDNVATREVRNSRSLHREALQRPDAGGLTQALGTRDAEFLRSTTQRFIVEEDGLLLLCSDGLSDNGWVEQSWREYAAPVLEGKLALADAVRAWIDLANLKNGHDNTSVVMTHYQTSTTYPLVFVPKPGAVTSLESEFSEASQALMATETAPVAAQPSRTKGQRWFKGLLIVLGLLGLLLGGTAIGALTLRQLYPKRYIHLCRKLPASLEALCQVPRR